MENQKIKSIFLGQVRRKFYSCWNEISEGTEFVAYEKLHECDLDVPPLVKDEKIYIPELDITLQVANVLKSSDGSITYQTFYTIRTIEDENTAKSYEAAKVKLAERKKEKEEREKKEKEIQKIVEETKYIEKDGIARCIGVNQGNNGDTNILAYYNKHQLTLIETISKSTIVLNSRDVDNLVKFLNYIKSLKLLDPLI